MNVIFDVGQVLVRWDPKPVLLDLFGGEAALAAFLDEVDFAAWHIEQDRGRTPAEAMAVARAEFPAYAPRLSGFYDRWLEMVPSAVDGAVGIMERLEAAGVPLYAITDFPAEQWAKTVPAYPFLERFRDVVVSGHVKMLKPEPGIYRTLLERNDLDPAVCIFIDDGPDNVDGAKAVGMDAIRFTGAPALAAALRERGLPA